MVRSDAATQDDAPPPAGHNNPPSFIDLWRESLQEVYGAKLTQVAPIADRANAAPATIASDDDLKTWAEIGRDAAKLEKELDESRKNEKRPIVALVDGFFGDAVDRAGRISAAAVAKATAWNKKKAEIARKAQEAEAKRLREEAERKRIEAEFAIDEATTVVAGSQAAALEIRADMAAEPQTTADLTRVKTDSGVTATTAKTWKFEIVDMNKIDLNAIRMFIDPKAIQTAIGKIVRTQKGATKIEGVRVFEEETAQFRG